MSSERPHTTYDRRLTTNRFYSQQDFVKVHGSGLIRTSCVEPQAFVTVAAGRVVTKGVSPSPDVRTPTSGLLQDDLVAFPQAS